MKTAKWFRNGQAPALRKSFALADVVWLPQNESILLCELLLKTLATTAVSHLQLMLVRQESVVRGFPWLTLFCHDNERTKIPSGSFQCRTVPAKRRCLLFWSPVNIWTCWEKSARRPGPGGTGRCGASAARRRGPGDKARTSVTGRTTTLVAGGMEWKE